MQIASLPPRSRLLAQASHLLARVGRDRPFTRREQLSLVLASHFGILVGAFIIEGIFHLSSGLPVEFVLCEIIIIILAIPFSVSFPGLEDVFRFAAGPPPKVSSSGNEAIQREAEKKESVENFAGGVLILASVLQFAALASLLWGTGGPIESPFAEMTLIIAVFTPFIANNPKTIGGVVAASIAYYAIFIWLYTNAYPPPEGLRELERALETPSPSVWAYFSVNIMILVGGTAFTTLESLLRNSEMSMAAARESAAEASAAENGEGDAASDVCEEPAEDAATPSDGNGAGGPEGGRDEDTQPA